MTNKSQLTLSKLSSDIKNVIIVHHNCSYGREWWHSLIQINDFKFWTTLRDWPFAVSGKMLQNLMVIHTEVVEMWIKFQKYITTFSETEKCWKQNLGCFGNVISEGSPATSKAEKGLGSNSSEMRQHQSEKWMDKKGPDCRLGAGNGVMQTHKMLFQTGREGTKRSFSTEWEQLPRVAWNAHRKPWGCQGWANSSGRAAPHPCTFHVTLPRCWIFINHRMLEPQNGVGWKEP